MKKQLLFNGEVINVNVKHHAMFGNICEINNVWFKVDGNEVTNEFIRYEKFLYPYHEPLKSDLETLGVI